MFIPAPSARRTSIGEVDFSDRQHIESRLIRGAFRTARRSATLAELARLSQPANQSRMVFVVGAARSGTTALPSGLGEVSDNLEALYPLLCEAVSNLKPARSRFRAALSPAQVVKRLSGILGARVPES
jgi:hypothetical protein